MKNLSRREFLKGLAVVGAGIATAGLSGCDDSQKGKRIVFLQDYGGRALVLKSTENEEDISVGTGDTGIFYDGTGIVFPKGEALVLDKDTFVEDIVQLQKVIELSNENEPYGINTVIYRKKGTEGFSVSDINTDFSRDFEGYVTGVLASDIKIGDYLVFDSRRKVFLDTYLAYECGLEYQSDAIIQAQKEDLEDVKIDDRYEER